MDPKAVEKAADILWRARLAGDQIDALPPDCQPHSLDDGYMIQDVMTARTGRAVLGWKVAATTEAGRRRMGIGEPLAGRLFADFVLPDGARLDAATMNMRVAEPEFAFSLGHDLSSRAAPYELDEVLAAVADLHLAIEVPDARLERFTEAGAPGTVADDAFAGWVVLGPTVADWRSLDLSARAVRVIRNGRIAGENSGGDALGEPCQALLWLAQDQAKRGQGLKAGDIIVSGTRLKPVEILPGDRVTVDFLGLGEVRVCFD
jgi:2-keto-4-pentenoate hydratase